MNSAATAGQRRVGLDGLVAQMASPGFVARFGRISERPERNGHVSPFLLSVQSSRSRYVRRWRRHARRCRECAAVFRQLGLSLG
jgi:hypothetical protein